MDFLQIFCMYIIVIIVLYIFINAYMQLLRRCMNKVLYMVYCYY